MKWYKKKCQVCGDDFASTVNNAKFCEKCRRKEYGKTRRKHIAGTLNDTDAMRKMCLSCGKPRCSGTCEELAELARRMKHGEECTA